MTTLEASLNVALYQLALSFNLVTTSTQWWSTVRAVAAESNVSNEEAAHILIATAMDMEAVQIEEGSELCPDCGAFLYGEQMDLDEPPIFVCSERCGYAHG